MRLPTRIAAVAVALVVPLLGASAAQAAVVGNGAADASTRHDDRQDRDWGNLDGDWGNLDGDWGNLDGDWGNLDGDWGNLSD